MRLCEFLYRLLLAVGLEDGEIMVFDCNEQDDDLSCNLLTTVGNMDRHTAAVKRLKWRPRMDLLCLASCSVDHCVKIFNFHI